jgi:hypothetical protein
MHAHSKHFAVMTAADIDLLDMGRRGVAVTFLYARLK